MDQLPPKDGRLVDNDDVKYVSRLSTILVATIEEAKDRISQIEYIFCNQLYPNVQSKYKNSQEVYLEAKKQVEEGWKEKESDLLLRIEKLEREKQVVDVENQSLKLEKEKLSAELKEMTKSVAELGSEQGRISLLEEKLDSKSKEVDEGVEMSNRLIRMVQTKSSKIVEQSQQIKEYEEKSNALVKKVEGLEEKVESLTRAKESGGLKSTVLNEEKLAEAEREKMKLKEQLMCTEEMIDALERNLKDKTRELEQLDERITRKFIVQVRDLEEKVKELESNTNGTKVEELLNQVQARDTELLDEKEKKRDLINAYKSLKSQYNYLLEKCGLITENMVLQTKLKDGDDSVKHHKSPVTSPDLKGSDYSTFPLKVKTEKVEYGFNDGLITNSVRKPVPKSRFWLPPHPPTVKPASISGVKRPASAGWIETRPGQSKRGSDPHDDFLSTPLEALRANNLSKAITEEEEAKDVGFPAEVNPNPPPDTADEETQNMNVAEEEAPGKKGFKYVETVRKKAERENLKGVECKQCKKFYNAVLPDDEGGGNKNQNLRCEHHEGVSRHRYRGKLMCGLGTEVVEVKWRNLKC